VEGRFNTQGAPVSGPLAIVPRLSRRVVLALGVLLTGCMVLLATAGSSARAAGGNSLAPLSSVAVPSPSNLNQFVRDNVSAVKLGKALFWDMQAGSDGRQACATCHFNAGADNRSRNQLNPRGGSFEFGGPNSQLSAADFPVHNGTVVGSQGVIPAHFNGVTGGDPIDGQLDDPLDSAFNLGGVNVRRATGRNTPSAINAVFNFRNFWDGRAQNDFNGVNPFGNRDVNATVGRANGSGGVDHVALTGPLSLTNASLASQAVGPPGNPVEMSADGRSLSDIGQKLLGLKPLGTQKVSSTDSVLGGLAAGGRGLDTSYADLIRQAFKPEWWDSSQTLAANGRNYNLMQYNFALFWGLAIQAYESTLVSDQTPMDKFLAGDASAMSAAAQTGMGIFQGKGGCITCHSGAETTSASVSNVTANGITDADGPHDQGFENIGVRPTAADPGNAGTDPFGAPLSATLLAGTPTTMVGGTFKVPSLRNVALTAPYFHNGSRATLRQVVDFYSDGGDFANPEKSNEIKPLGLSDQEKTDLVSFLESLTDPRVRDQSAPFDHPQLFVAAGHQTNSNGTLKIEDGRAQDCFLEVPATGAAGGAALPAFLDFKGPPCASVPSLRTPRAAGNSGPSVKPVVQVKGKKIARCLVPRLKGKSISSAKALLKRNHCALSKAGLRLKAHVRYVVSSQSPRAGLRRNGGTKVKITVRRLRSRH
jgi:cytochrome c peroxidase